MRSRLDEATEEQLRRMLRLLGTCEYPDDALRYYIRWAQGTETFPLSPAAVIGHMEMFVHRAT